MGAPTGAEKARLGFAFVEKTHTSWAPSCFPIFMSSSGSSALPFFDVFYLLRRSLFAFVPSLLAKVCQPLLRVPFWTALRDYTHFFSLGLFFCFTTRVTRAHRSQSISCMLRAGLAYPIGMACPHFCSCLFGMVHTAHRSAANAFVMAVWRQSVASTNKVLLGPMSIRKRSAAC